LIRQLLSEFAKTCQTMIVIEERRSFLEKNLREAISHDLSQDEAANISARLFGKRFPAINAGQTAADCEGIPESRGLNYSVLAQKLIPLIQSIGAIPPDKRNGRLSAEIDRLRQASRPKLAVFNEAVVARTPTFCPAVRTATAVRPCLNSAAISPTPRIWPARTTDTNRWTSSPTAIPAATPCSCSQPTEQLMHNYSGMGLGGGTGSGIDPFITNKQIVFMGDGTFFHSGAIAISNSIKGRAGHHLHHPGKQKPPP